VEKISVETRKSSVATPLATEKKSQLQLHLQLRKKTAVATPHATTKKT
jgi:hypothetical protein